MNRPVRITGHTAVSFEPVNAVVDHVVKNKPSGKIKLPPGKEILDKITAGEKFPDKNTAWEINGKK